MVLLKCTTGEMLNKYISEKNSLGFFLLVVLFNFFFIY